MGKPYRCKSPQNRLDRILGKFGCGTDLGASFPIIPVFHPFQHSIVPFCFQSLMTLFAILSKTGGIATPCAFAAFSLMTRLKASDGPQGISPGF